MTIRLNASPISMARQAVKLTSMAGLAQTIISANPYLRIKQITSPKTTLRLHHLHPRRLKDEDDKQSATDLRAVGLFNVRSEKGTEKKVRVKAKTRVMEVILILVGLMWMSAFNGRRVRFKGKSCLSLPLLLGLDLRLLRISSVVRWVMIVFPSHRGLVDRRGRL